MKEDKKDILNKQIDTQLLLDKILNKELTNLKRICFKGEHRKLLNRQITICERDLSEIKASGLYETLQIEGKSKYHYTHKITIDKQIIDRYLNYKYEKYDSWAGINKTYYKNVLKNVIIHEITHAFVYEYFDGWIDVEGAHRDSSPIYLAVLYFFNGISHHNCVQAFKRTDLYKDVIRMRSTGTFKELNAYLTKLLMDYDKIARKLNKIEEVDFESKTIKQTITTFQFADIDAGLIGSIRLWDNVIHDDYKYNLESQAFFIGVGVTPDRIPELVRRKNYNDNFRIRKNNNEIVPA